MNIIGGRERYDREKVLKFIGLVMWAFAVSMGSLWLLAGLFDSFGLFLSLIHISRTLWKRASRPATS